MSKKVSDILPKTEILGQLAEELAEASAAASKLRRKIDGKNPTPKTLEECWKDLKNVSQPPKNRTAESVVRLPHGAH